MDHQAGDQQRKVTPAKHISNRDAPPLSRLAADVQRPPLPEKPERKSDAHTNSGTRPRDNGNWHHPDRSSVSSAPPLQLARTSHSSEESGHHTVARTASFQKPKYSLQPASIPENEEVRHINQQSLVLGTSKESGAKRRYVAHLLGSPIGWGAAKLTADGSPNKIKEAILELNEENKKLRHELHYAFQQIELVRRELEKNLADSKWLETANRDLEKQVQRSKGSADALQRELSKVTRKYDEVKAHSDACEKEHQGHEAISNLRRLARVLGASSVLDLLDCFGSLITSLKLTAMNLTNFVEHRESDAFDDDITRTAKSVSDQLGEAYTKAVIKQNNRGMIPELLRALFQTLIAWELCKIVGAVSVLRVDNEVAKNGSSFSTLFHGRPCHPKVDFGTTSFPAFKASFLKLLADVFKLGNWTIRSAGRRKEFEGGLEKLFDAGQALKDAMLIGEDEQWKHFEIGIVKTGVFPMKTSEDREQLKVWCPSGRESFEDSPHLLGTLLPGLKLVSKQKGNSNERLECIVRPTVLSQEAMETIMRTSNETDPRGDGRPA